MKHSIRIFLLIISITICQTSQGGLGSQSVNRTRPLTLPDFKFLDINTVKVTCNSDGDFASSHLTNTAGCEWPKGTGKTCIYAAGLWISGIHRPTHAIRGAFMDYVNEFQPGPLLQTFNTTSNKDSAANARASDPMWHLYKISRSDTNNPAGNPDYTGWPGGAGAPFVDVNGNGVWDQGIDVPKFYGDQQLWTVCNDVNDSLKSKVGTTAPMGVEVRCLYYADSLTGPLGNVVFLKWTIINKSDADYDSTYVSLWTDIDLGNGNNDLPGCDTTLDLGYIYNDRNDDGPSFFAYGIDPPADGFELLQGPRIPGLPSDSALVDGKWIRGFRNLPLTAAVNYFSSTFPQLVDAPLGNSQFPSIAYDYMKGLAGTKHLPVYSTITGQQITRWFSGEPEMAPPTGDLPPNFYFGPVSGQDTKTILSSGPFTLSQGDTQEVVWAFLIARGSDNLNSISLLKQCAVMAREGFGGAPVLWVGPVYRYQHVDSTVQLLSSMSVPVTQSQWSIVEKPDSSLASIAAPGDMSTSIIPDVPGFYSIKLTVDLQTGARDSTVLSFTAIRNEPPVVAFTLPESVVLGDTIRVDCSGIRGPLGDSLSVRWSIDGGHFIPPPSLSFADTSMGKMIDSSGSHLTFVPFRASRFTFRVSVSDQFYSTDSLKTVTVTPLATQGLALKGRYDTTGIPNTGSYQFGRIKEFDSQIWFSGYGSLFTPNFSNNAEPAQAYELGPGDYDIRGTQLWQTNGPGVDMNVTDGYRNIVRSRFLRMTTPGTPFVSVANRSPYLVFTDSAVGFFVYDVSTIVRQVSHVTDGDIWGEFVGDGNLFYCVDHGENTLKVIDISVPSIPVIRATLHLGTGYVHVRKSGNDLYVVKPDTIRVLNAANPDAIVPVGIIPLPHTCLPQSQFYDICPYGNYLVAGTQEGCYIYDVTNRAAPTLYARYITGYPHVSTFLNAQRLITVQWDRAHPAVPGREDGFFEFESPIVAVKDASKSLPVAFSLDQNYPNPFNPTTTIRFELPRAVHVSLIIYNLLGQEVTGLVDEEMQAGVRTVEFNAAGLASGMYFYRLKAGEFVSTRKLILVR